MNRFVVLVLVALIVISDAEASRRKETENEGKGVVLRRKSRRHLRREIKIPARFKSQIGDQLSTPVRLPLVSEKKKKRLESAKAQSVRSSSPAVDVSSDPFQEPALEVKESTYLTELGVSGQSGLYAGEKIKKGQFIGWYTGKVYFSVRDTFQIVSRREMIGSQKEFSYFFDVKDHQSGEYLYTVDAFQAVDGSDQMCHTAYINHKPQRLANAEFRTVLLESAPGGLAPAVFATRQIQAGEELTIDYGSSYEAHLQSHAPGYRAFLEAHAPKALLEGDEDAPEVASSEPLSRLYELHPALFKDLFGAPVEIFADLDEELIKIVALERSKDEALQKKQQLEEVSDSYQKTSQTLESLRDPALDQLNQAYRRLAYLHWRLALVSLGLQSQSVSEEEKLSFLGDRLSHAHAASQYYAKAMALHASPSLAFAELGRVIKELDHGDPKLLSKRELEKRLKEDHARLQSEADGFREEAELILLEDSNPLKPHADKVAHRQEALSYYHFGLYLIEDQAGDEFEILRAHFRWGLAEAYSDHILSQLEVAYPLALQAFEDYKAYIDRTGTDLYNEDLVQAEATYKRLKKALKKKGWG
jgi:hypothetical protein